MSSNIHIETGRKSTPKSTPKKDTAAPTDTRSFFSGARRTARATSPAAVNLLTSEMRARIEEDTALDGLQIAPYIGKKDGRNLSGVIAYVDLGHSVVIHFVAVAAACELNSREIPVDSYSSQKVTMDTFISDLYNPATVGFIRDEVERIRKGTSETTWHNAGCSVLRAKHTDASFSEIAPNFANIAYDAILDYASHVRLTNEALFNVNILKGHQPRAHISVQPQQVLTLDGLPKRADLSVSVLAQFKNDEGMEPIEFTRATGYMNFIYRKPQVQYVHGQAIPSTEYFQPEIIVTEATAMTHANTLESILYAIYSMDSLITDHRWLNLYRDNHATGGKNSVNPYNLGALNIDLPNINDPKIDDKIIQTGDHAWVESGLYDFAARYFTKTIGKAIDIPETGPSARLLGLLRATIETSDMNEKQLANCKAARRQVISAADTLSGGKFSAKLGDAPLFIPTVERIIIGTYVEDGIEKDLAHIEHLSVLNEAGEKDPDLAFRLEKTYTNTSVPEIVRIRERLDLYKLIKGASMKACELGYRIRMTSRASAALAQAINDNKVSLYIEGVGSIQAQPERGADYLQGDYGIGMQDAAGFSNNGNVGAGEAYTQAYQW